MTEELKKRIDEKQKEIGLVVCGIECELFKLVREDKITKEVALIKFYQSLYVMHKMDKISWDGMKGWFGKFTMQLFKLAWN